MISLHVLRFHATNGICVVPVHEVPSKGLQSHNRCPRRAPPEPAATRNDPPKAGSRLPRQQKAAKPTPAHVSVTPHRPIGVWSFDGSAQVEHSLTPAHRVPPSVEEEPRGPATGCVTERCGRVTRPVQRRSRSARPETVCEETSAQPANQTAAAADQVETGPTDALLDRHGLLRMQVQGLEELNQQSLTRISNIFAPNYLPTPEEREEGTALMMEVGVRRRFIIGMSSVMDSLEVELRARGVDPREQTAFLEDEEAEDPDVCQFCLTNKIGMEYECCHFRGACVDCAVAMRSVAARCPHCRADVPPTPSLNLIVA